MGQYIFPGVDEYGICSYNSIPDCYSTNFTLGNYFDGLGEVCPSDAPCDPVEIPTGLANITSGVAQFDDYLYLSPDNEYCWDFMEKDCFDSTLRTVYEISELLTSCPNSCRIACSITMPSSAPSGVPSVAPSGVPSVAPSGLPSGGGD